MRRSNHYEAAFEGYLQWHRLGYVAVDETRRSLLGDVPVKSLDFIVFGTYGSGLLVDVKGRRYPAGPPERPRRVWECWSTQADVDGLERWQGLFGPAFRALLVFAYRIMPGAPLPAADEEDLWTWRGRRYLFRAVPVAAYRPHARTRSPRWGTVSLSCSIFRELARPFRDFSQGYLGQQVDECPF
jgi:hypothetical protein